MGDKDVTFSQRSGEEAPRKPLQVGHLSEELRMGLWNVVYEKISWSKKVFNLKNNWEAILSDYHAHYLNLSLEDFSLIHYIDSGHIKNLILKGDYNRVFDFLEIALNHQSCPGPLFEEVSNLLKKHRASYRLRKSGLKVQFVLKGMKRDHLVCEKSIKNLKERRFQETREHLENSAEYIRKNDYIHSVEESLLALKAVASLFSKELSDDFAWALDDFTNCWPINQKFKEALSQLFGYTITNKKFHHCLIEKPEVLDDLDADFFLNACTIFVSYLIQKEKRSYRYDK